MGQSYGNRAERRADKKNRVTTLGESYYPAQTKARCGERKESDLVQMSRTKVADYRWPGKQKTPGFGGETHGIFRGCSTVFE